MAAVYRPVAWFLRLDTCTLRVGYTSPRDAFVRDPRFMRTVTVLVYILLNIEKIYDFDLRERITGFSIL